MTATSQEPSQALPRWRKLNQPIDIAPLAMFRIIFGALMLFATFRYMWNGWIEEIYITPTFHFKYFGFEWVQAPGATGMYLLFAGVAVGALLIMLGLFYRWGAALFFLCFTYVELIDKTTYLNHYYFISLVALLLIFLPAHRKFSLDVRRKPVLMADQVPARTIYILMFQIGVVYFFAGVAKLNYDWLFEAMPLAIWLPPHSDFPVIGELLTEKWFAYAMSWAGALYDLTIVFALLFRRTRPWAYAAVVVFHVFTWALFPIGIFPWVMIFCTLIFFPASFHRKIFSWFNKTQATAGQAFHYPKKSGRWLGIGMVVFACFQLLFPLRSWLYGGNLFWHEQGFRFSWRVMLMEKAGTAFFYVGTPNQPGELEVNNDHHLTPNQQKMMATQPDFILQYADYLAEKYRNEGIVSPTVRAEIWVTVNGEGSRLLVDPYIDLAAEEDGWKKYDWLIPYDEVITLDTWRDMQRERQGLQAH